MDFAELYEKHLVFREAQTFHENMCETYMRMIDSGEMTKEHTFLMVNSVNSHIRSENYHKQPGDKTPFTDNLSDWLKRGRIPEYFNIKR